MFRRAIGSRIWHCTPCCHSWPKENWVEEFALAKDHEMCPECTQQARKYLDCVECSGQGGKCLLHVHATPPKRGWWLYDVLKKALTINK